MRIRLNLPSVTTAVELFGTPVFFARNKVFNSDLTKIVKEIGSLNLSLIKNQSLKILLIDPSTTLVKAEKIIKDAGNEGYAILVNSYNLPKTNAGISNKLVA